MRAIDTNVLIRFVTGDDGTQALRARALIEAGDIFVATTVLLECEWVLRSAYDFDPGRIAAAFRAFAGLPGVTLEDPRRIARALDWTERGMDFADALHLAGAEGCSAFLTFDRRLAEIAADLSGTAVRTP
ncbi:MAG: type II toxin-antitoxin system VapC family toxin [Alphaproteobacteria bacterium]